MHAQIYMCKHPHATHKHLNSHTPTTHNVRNTTTVCTKDGFFPPFITSEILVKSVLDRLIVLFWSYWFLTGQRSFAAVHFWCFDFRSSEVTLILALKKVTSDCLIQFWSRSRTLLQGTYNSLPLVIIIFPIKNVRHSDSHMDVYYAFDYCLNTCSVVYVWTVDTRLFFSPPTKSLGTRLVANVKLFKRVLVC